MNAEVDFVKLLKAGATPTSISADLLARLQFSTRRKVIKHTRFKKAFDEIARLHYRGVHAKVAEGLLLVAQSGSGKSTLIRNYEEQFPRYLLAGVMMVTVLRVETPEAPTVKTLAEAILLELNDPYASKGNGTQKTDRIIYLCKRCGVQLLILDEFQHFSDSGRIREAERVTNWLKLLLLKLQIPVVVVGLPRSIAVVNSNPQLRRRFGAPHYLAPFSLDSEAERLEFRGVLKQLGKGLPPGSVQVDEPQLAQRFFHASCGLMDYLVKIVDDAASRGGTGVNGAITLADLSMAFKRTVWSVVPDRLDPFGQRPQMRLLTRLGEPFEGQDNIATYLLGGRAHRAAAAPTTPGASHAAQR